MRLPHLIRVISTASVCQDCFLKRLLVGGRQVHWLHLHQEIVSDRGQNPNDKINDITSTASPGLTSLAIALVS